MLVLLLFAATILGVPLDYPAAVSLWPVRRDTTGSEVTRGRLAAIYGKTFKDKDLFLFDRVGPGADRYTTLKKYPLKELRRLLQCSPTEPDLDAHTGSISMLRLAPPTKRTTEIISAWAETHCKGEMHRCHAEADVNKQGGYHKDINMRGGFSGFGMLRVVNGSLFHDWPWGRERLIEWKSARADLGNVTTKMLKNHFEIYKQGDLLIHAALRIVSDMPDSLFLMGGEQPFLEWNVPFPAFSNAPRYEKNDMPWPFEEIYVSAAEAASIVVEQHGGDFSDSTMKKLFGGQAEWSSRTPKAAFFAGYHKLRHFVYDSAVLRPDLIEAPLITRDTNPSLTPWNPLSPEPYYNTTAGRNRTDWLRPGFAHYLETISVQDGKQWHGGKFKYIVVIGHEDSLTGRLSHALSFSGAVILLPQTPFHYHFSAKLEPWVHYVPLSYTSADLIEKLEFLRAHDDIAQQIAQNGLNFAKSYLRFEDHVCFALAALKTVADVEAGSDILTEFDEARPYNMSLALEQDERRSLQQQQQQKQRQQQQPRQLRRRRRLFFSAK